MLEAEYLLFIEDKSVDDRNRLTLHNISDRAYVPDFPVRVEGLKAHFKLVPKTKALVGATLNIKIALRLDTQEVGKIEAVMENINIEKGLGFCPTFDLSQLVFPESGEYQFGVFVDDKQLIERQFTVRPVSELVEE